MVLTSFFRGLGDTRTPLYVTLFANAVNVVLDYGLIFGELGLPAWGVRGAGAATAVGQLGRRRRLYARLPPAQSIAKRFDTRPVRTGPERPSVRFLRTGAPIGGQWCIGMTSFACFTTVVARMGDASMAASQAFVMLLSLSFMQAVGISIAASTLVGRYVGARDQVSAKRSFRSSIQIGLLLSGVIATPLRRDPGAAAAGSSPTIRRSSRWGGRCSPSERCSRSSTSWRSSQKGRCAERGTRAGPSRWRRPWAGGSSSPSPTCSASCSKAASPGAWIGGLVYVCTLALVLVRRFRSGAWQKIAI